MGYYRNNRKVESGNAAAGVRAFPFYDGNGNICGYADASGVVQTRYLYDGFLNVTQTGTASYRYQASTKSWNPALGLLEYQFRAYAPTLGRWIQEDPIEEAGGKNLYGFVNNNPIMRCDLWGRVSLGTKISLEAAWRVEKILLFGTSGIVHNWLTQNDPVYFEDEGQEIFKLTYTMHNDMRSAILDYVRDNRRLIKNTWQVYALPDTDLRKYGQPTMVSMGKLSAGWWLNGPDGPLTVNGKFAICEASGTIYLKDANLTYAWDDNIDANNWDEMKHKTDDILSKSMELGWNYSWESLYATNFRAIITGNAKVRDYNIPTDSL